MTDGPFLVADTACNMVVSLTHALVGGARWRHRRAPAGAFTTIAQALGSVAGSGT